MIDLDISLGLFMLTQIINAPIKMLPYGGGRGGNAQDSDGRKNKVSEMLSPGKQGLSESCGLPRRGSGIF